jgi:HEAT repeat protein
MLGARLLQRLFPSVRRLEHGRFAFFSGLFALLTFAQTVGLAASEALFLARRGPDELPLAFVLASALTVTGSLAYAMLVGRRRNDTLFIQMLGLSALLLLVLGAMAWQGMSVAFLALYCAFYLLQAVFVNLHYWTFAADFFDTIASKRLFPLFAVGSSTGGVVGGLLSAGLCQVAPVEVLIVPWVGGLLAAGGLVWWGRHHLRRWGPLGLEEADESSVEGVRGALRYLQRSSLARWLVLSVVGMVFSLFLIQFLYSRAFQESLGSAEELAAFIGVYLALTNVIEIAVSRVLTPMLIARFGVAQANLLHPLLTIATFVLLAADSRIYAAVIARMNRELLENAMAMPIRSLSYNALPFRFRGRMRAFLEGIVTFAAMSVAGGALMLLGTENLQVGWLCLVGGGAALVYFVSNLQVRREYLRSLVHELGAGRLDLAEVSGELGAADVAGLAEQFERLLEEDGSTAASILQLAPLLAERGFTEALHRGASHADPRVRIACLDALALNPSPSLVALIVTCLADDREDVRLSAARAAAFSPPEEHPEALERALYEALIDEDAAVRAEAALHLGTDGLATLEEMAASDDEAHAVNALERLPAALLERARARSDEEQAAVRAAAVAAITRLSSAAGLAPEQLLEDLRHPDPRVRRAAAEALGAQGDEARAPALAEMLDDSTRAVRSAASEALSRLGDAGVQSAATVLGGLRVWTVDAALNTLAAADTTLSRQILAQAFRDRVIDAWKGLVALTVLSSDGSLPSRFMQTALGNSVARSHWVAFRILELIEDPAVVRSVTKGLRVQSMRARADALEVLTHLGEREAAQLLALLLESGPLPDKISSVTGVVPIPSGPGAMLRQLQDSSDRWIKMAATILASDDFEVGDQEVRTMEGLLALRNVSLFTHLTLEQLEVINQLMRESHYLVGEAVVREGDEGDDLYVLLEGAVDCFKNHGTKEEIFLSTLTTGMYFGEIAIFDSAPRSATVVVTNDARLLSLDGERFKQLIVQTPEIAFEIFRVLTARIRAAEERTEG